MIHGGMDTELMTKDLVKRLYPEETSMSRSDYIANAKLQTQLEEKYHYLIGDYWDHIQAVFHDAKN